MLRTRPPLLAALLALAALVAPVASAAPAPRVSLPVPAIDAVLVRAGAEIEVRWSAPPAGVEELELLLSVDGGRHYPLRASPELEGREDRWRWRVPAIASHEARLRIRMKLAGREVEGPAGPAFTIEAPPGAARERAPFHESGSWGPVHAAEAAPRSAWGSAASRLERGCDPDAAQAPTRIDPATLPARAWPASSGARARTAAPRRLAAGARPRRIALRI